MHTYPGGRIHWCTSTKLSYRPITSRKFRENRTMTIGVAKITLEKFRERPLTYCTYAGETALIKNK